MPLVFSWFMSLLLLAFVTVCVAAGYRRWVARREGGVAGGYAGELSEVETAVGLLGGVEIRQGFRICRIKVEDIKPYCKSGHSGEYVRARLIAAGFDVYSFYWSEPGYRESDMLVFRQPIVGGQ